jgi:hypothetical protein
MGQHCVRNWHIILQPESLFFLAPLQIQSMARVEQSDPWVSWFPQKDNIDLGKCYKAIITLPTDFYLTCKTGGALRNKPPGHTEVL